MANYAKADTTIKSQFNCTINLHPNTLEKVNADFFEKKVADFKQQIYPGKAFDTLSATELMTDMDFRIKGYLENYFYPLTIVVKKQAYGTETTLNLTPKLVITFDKKLCTLDKDGFSYGEISLGGSLVLAYLYIDFQELIDFVRGLG